MGLRQGKDPRVDQVQVDGVLIISSPAIVSSALGPRAKGLGRSPLDLRKRAVGGTKIEEPRIGERDTNISSPKDHVNRESGKKQLRRLDPKDQDTKESIAKGLQRSRQA